MSLLNQMVLTSLNSRGVRIDVDEVNKQKVHLSADTPQKLSIKQSLYNTYSVKRVFPQYRTKAITGRITTFQPNIQGIPRGEFRKIILPHSKDYFLFQADYKQAEFALLADLIGNKKMTDDLNSGWDFHSHMAERIGYSRETAKTINFAAIYGAGEPAIKETLNKKTSLTWRDQDIATLMQYYRSILNSNLFPFFSYSKREVTTWTGRKIPLLAPYKALNYYLQGGIADVMRMALLEIAEKVPEVVIYIFIHDNIIFCLEDNKPISKIIKIMESVYKSKNGIKLKVNALLNPNFDGNLYETNQPFFA